MIAPPTVTAGNEAAPHGGVPLVHYWRGKPVTDLSRTELYEMIDYMTRELAVYRSPEAIRQRARGRAAEFFDGAPR